MILKIKADTCGIASGTICLIHCAVTPFLFLAKTCSTTNCTDAPFWWELLDYVFIVISFIAIYNSISSTTKNWVRITLWCSWISLLLIILNESFGMISLPEMLGYLPALSIILLHFYNHKVGKCVKDCTV